MPRVMKGMLGLALLAIAQQAGAQAQQGSAPPKQSIVLKGKAPVSNEVLKVTLPKPKQGDLANGIHLMVLEDHRTPQVAYQLIIPGAGGYFDAPGSSGVASITATMMREGTTSRNTNQISEQLETMAASLNVGTGVSSTDASVSGGALTEGCAKTPNTELQAPNKHQIPSSKRRPTPRARRKLDCGEFMLRSSLQRVPRAGAGSA